MSKLVQVWGINGLGMEIEENWVNPLLEAGAITLENPAKANAETGEPTKPAKRGK